MASSDVPHASGATADFEGLVVAADEAGFEIQKRQGEVVYVRLLSGTLPVPLHNVLVRSQPGGYSRTLFGRPHIGAFAPTPATLRVVSGRAYAVTILAVLAPCGELSPYLRAGLRPPRVVDATCIPLALEGLSERYLPLWNRFRSLDGFLTSGWTPDAEVDRQDGEEGRRVLARAAALRPLGQLGTGVNANTIEILLRALYDEPSQMRGAASYALRAYASLLPVEPFLAVAHDPQPLNAEACEVAAHVFGAHPESVPLAAVLELFRQAPDPNVAALTVWAMSQYGDRAPVDLLGRMLLVYFETGVHEAPWMGYQTVSVAAARALRTLGGLAPVEALIAGLYDMATAMDCARALLVHPGQVPQAMLREAQAIVNGDKPDISHVYPK